MIGEIAWVEVEITVTALTVDVAAGSTVLSVGSAVGFSDGGGLLIIDQDAPRAYVDADQESGTLTLAAPLAATLTADTPVSACDVLGTVLQERWCHCYLGGQINTTPVLIPTALEMDFPEGDALAGFHVPVGTDSRGQRVVLGKADQASGKDGEQMTVQSIPADKLTVGATGVRVANGTFEDHAPDGLFAGWWPSFWFAGDKTKTRVDEATEPGSKISGSRSLVIAHDDGTCGWKVLTAGTPIPVRPGQVFVLSGMVAADQTVSVSLSTGNSLADLVFQTSTDLADPDDIFTSEVSWQAAPVDALSPVPVLVSQAFTVPDGHTRLRVACRTNPSGGGAWKAIFDQVELAQVGEASTAPVVIDDWTTFRDSQGRTLAQAFGLTPVAAGSGSGKTFPATASRWYSSAGVRKDAGVAEVKVGNGSDSWGNRRGAIWWDSAAVAAAIGSGSGYSKVEIRLTLTAHAKPIANTIHLGTHTDATVRSAWGDITGKTASSLAAPEFRIDRSVWVDITSIVSVADLVAQAKRGLLVGPAPSDSLDYAVTLAGVGASAATAPLLRVS